MNNDLCPGSERHSQMYDERQSTGVSIAATFGGLRNLHWLESVRQASRGRRLLINLRIVFPSLRILAVRVRTAEPALDFGLAARAARSHQLHSPMLDTARGQP